LPYITTWDDSQSQNRPTNSAEEALFFTGFFKPVIGMSFALFVFTVISSGILPISVAEEKSRYFFAALGFVSGFSERFASDVASRTEKAISSSQSAVK
jgi:hypothetical protein